jgi:hypothetical protein
MKEYFKTKFGARAVLSCLVFLLAPGAVLIGCATRDTLQTQLDLGSSGFHWKIADTPERLKHLQSLPQKRVVRHKKDGGSFYYYADTKDCKCIYMGNEKAYQQYLRLLHEKHVETRKDTAIDDVNLMGRDSAITVDWAVWGDLPVE